MTNTPPRKLSIGLPPSGMSISNSIAIKKENPTGTHSSSGSFGSTRKDSMGWIADDFLGMISHTPPAFSPGSLTLPMTKRNRSGSISGRLLSASDLEEKGFIDRYQKGILKVK